MNIKVTEMRINYRLLFISFMTCMFLVPAVSNAEQSYGARGKENTLVYSGYFAREENDGKMARLSKKSHYMQFLAPNRVIRLFVPYPYSTTVKPEVISKVFSEVSKMAVGDAYVKGKFGHLDENAIANIGKINDMDDLIQFDCDARVPCKIKFFEGGLKVIKAGVLADHIIMYEHVGL
jgi:hypothetical protein